MTNKSKNKGTPIEGTSITEDEAAELAEILEGDDYEVGEPLPREEWPINRGRGRPSLAGGSGESPQLRVRVDPALYVQLQASADANDTSVSDIARTALQQHVERTKGTSRTAAR